MIELTKIRDERDLYSVDFTDDLAVGETLTGTPTVKVWKSTTAGWTDATSEFRAGEAAATISGDEVQFWLIAAATDEQDEGTYAIQVLAPTSTSRTTAGVDDDGNLIRLIVRIA